MANNSKPLYGEGYLFHIIYSCGLDPDLDQRSYRIQIKPSGPLSLSGYVNKIDLTVPLYISCNICDPCQIVFIYS